MIKTIYRGRLKSRYSEAEWFMLFVVVTVCSTIIVTLGTYWILYLFSEFYGAKLAFITVAAGISTPVLFLMRWMKYVGQNQRDEFDKKPEKKKSRISEVEDFISRVR